MTESVFCKFKQNCESPSRVHELFVLHLLVHQITNQTVTCLGILSESFCIYTLFLKSFLQNNLSLHVFTFNARLNSFDRHTSNSHSKLLTVWGPFIDQITVGREVSHWYLIQLNHTILYCIALHCREL